MKPSERFTKWFLITLMAIIGLWGLSRVINILNNDESEWADALVPFMWMFFLFFNLMVFQHRHKEDERWRRIMERSFFYSSIVLMIALAVLITVMASGSIGWTALQTALAIFVFFGLTNAVITIVLTKRM